ncbi:MAG: hypothetical protein V3V92_03520, partial [Candidatus Hydrothermarchaeales archaeon]
WLADYENQGNMAPLAMVRFDNESYPTPVYLHKPLMYKYEFTAGDHDESGDGISKGFNSKKLPPVIVIALGPFLTSFRGWIEPPDSGRDLPIDVELEESEDIVIVTAKLHQGAGSSEGGFLLKVYEVGNSNNENPVLSRETRGSLNEMPIKLEVKKTELPHLETHGWSLINADIYALDETTTLSDVELLDHVVGEDHANFLIIDPTLRIDAGITDYNGESIGIMNSGNRVVEVVLTADGGCCFFKERSNWNRDLWVGSLEAGETKRITIRPVGPVSLALKADIPTKIQRLLQNSTDMSLNDYYEIQ